MATVRVFLQLAAVAVAMNSDECITVCGMKRSRNDHQLE